VPAVVSFCDEVLVVDSHSTDSTRESARALGARVIERDWPGYRSQKQFAVDAAASDWVLCLDADERITLNYAMDRGPACAWLRRLLRFGRCRGSQTISGVSPARQRYPDRLIRLFDRRVVLDRGEIHETHGDGTCGPAAGH